MKKLLSFLGWLYLARVPLVGLLILLGLPAAAHGPLRVLAIGAFDLNPDRWAFVTGVLLPMAAWAVFLSGVIVFAYGQERADFHVADPPQWIFTAWRHAANAGVALNVWTIFGATAAGIRGPVMWHLLPGVFLGIIFVGVIERSWLLGNAAGNNFLGSNLHLYPRLVPSVSVATAKAAHMPPPVVVGPVPFWKGYVDNNGKLVPGMGILVGGLVIFLLLNVLIFFSGNESMKVLTALVYLLVMLITAVLLGGALAFFLDAYRIPFLSVCIGWTIVVSYWKWSDHYYRIWPREAGDGKSAQVLSPAQVLERAAKTGRPVVVVAVAGGGIQSTAWGTKVLTELERMVLDECPGPEDGTPAGPQPARADFAASIQCISGVSGGSTGAMFFVAGYGPGGFAAPGQPGAVVGKVPKEVLDSIVKSAEATSLGQTVWGLTYPDTERVWFPFFIRQQYLDRSQQMELRWAENWAAHAAFPEWKDRLKKATLADWQRGVVKGTRPAIIFNGTLVETGERISFSTAPVRHHYEGQREFTCGLAWEKDATLKDVLKEAQKGAELYPRATLNITTAARLSATFPFASATGRPLLARGPKEISGIPEKELVVKDGVGAHVPGRNGLLHVVDGGYYENTGLGALTKWLDDGLSELAGTDGASMPPSILIVELEAFPEANAEEWDESRIKNGPRKVTPKDWNAPQSQEAGERGALFQGTSPLVALYNVRGTGHTASTLQLMQTLQQRWLRTAPDASGKLGPTCAIKHVRFTIPKLPRRLERKSKADPEKYETRGYWEPAWADAKPESPPLSWHLRQIEKDEITAAWEALHDEWKARCGSQSGELEPGDQPIRQVMEFLQNTK